jgi:polar amino acid transport system substrate-binding protein
MKILSLLLVIVALATSGAAAQAPLRVGGDKAGGAPFYFDDPEKGEVGFEQELMELFGKKLGRPATFVQVDWDNLPDTLGRGDIDIALNGMEYREEWEADFPATIPYFIFSLRLIVRANDPSIKNWDDLRVAEGQPKKRVGVLRGSLAERYLEDNFSGAIELFPLKEVDETFQLVEEGERLDATVQDSPAAMYYVKSGRLPKLRVVGQPVAKGYYVVLTPKGKTEAQQMAAQAFRDKLNDAIREALVTGELEKILTRYKLWDADQERLAYRHLIDWRAIQLEQDEDASAKDAAPEKPKISRSIWSIRDKLLDATWMTIALAFSSMPLAIMAGILIAIGRLYGPALVRAPLSAYVEVIRGTPILLQMYVWFFLAPQMAKWTGWQPLIVITTLPPFVVGVFALAVNYSAYEAEIFRAGLQAIPRGQTEAALALGMSPMQAVRHVLLPQAVRVVIPPVTNDFIALFKDTSICSMILITELTGLYYQNKYDRDLVLQLALVIGAIYFFLSYPLSLLSRRLENRLRGKRVSS